MDAAPHISRGESIAARRTLVVDGLLAFHTARRSAARNGACGLQIMTLPQLAARLAGGFRYPARSQDVDAALHLALETGGFEEIEAMRELPGMTRALAYSLTRLWGADTDLAKAAKTSARMRDIVEIERRMRATLADGALSLRDLRDAALARVHLARATLGDVEIDQRTDVVPLWRPLIAALQHHIRVAWRDPAVTLGWFTGDVYRSRAAPDAAAASFVSCANPRSEVIEALRWVRERLTNGVPAGEIALVAAGTEAWDEHFEVLGSEAELPLHFAHGRTSLATYSGQACAALADVLVQGLNQRRVRRLIRYVKASECLKGLPGDWAYGLERDAALCTVQHWQLALDRAAAEHSGKLDPRPLLMPIVKLLARGADAAQEAGMLLLAGGARALWSEALRRAPARALLLSLEGQRLPDRRDPSGSVVWCPARQLAEAPRPYVRMLGLTARSWPRRGAEDPLLPSHIVSGDMLDPTWITQKDREDFRIIREGAAKELVISRSRRDAQGKILPPSSLTTQLGAKETALRRTRIPEHAFGEGDRLLARRAEAAELPQIRLATAAWRHRQDSALSPHDGLLSAEHPVVIRALKQVQSATSLRALLRDPLGFVWRYGLRWTAPVFDDQPLSLDPRVFGELVHDILRFAVCALEPSPGFRHAELPEIEDAVRDARGIVKEVWPLEIPVPPGMLWEHTLDLATELALVALTFDPRITAGSMSWPEALFGDPKAVFGKESPWASDVPVPIPGTDFKLRGRIDRLDVRIDANRRAAQVTDYKTGKPPEKRIVLDGGKELQRVTYVLAVKHLRPDISIWRARLLYLAKDGATPAELDTIDAAIATLTENVAAAEALLRRGIALPGRDAEDDSYDFRLAHAAGRLVYFGSKRGAIYQALGNAFVESWECP